LKTYHIHIEGRVQGVGFRPFIFGLARKYDFNGTVANTLEGVHIYINCDSEQLKPFINAIRQKSPVQAIITTLTSDEVDYWNYTDFKIVDSQANGATDLLITPDFGICDECKQELLDETNKRYLYPYITCTKCGPRYSIIKSLPFDRSRTSMDVFNMCPDCHTEYTDPLDRRFYSQTNTCQACRISQWITDRSGRKLEIEEEATIDFICEKI
jgi:hydrogenase maturation protein HypF